MFITSMHRSISLDDMTKTKIVIMILNKRTEEALETLSMFYNTTPPQVVVGTIKGMFKKKVRFMPPTLKSFTILL